MSEMDVSAVVNAALAEKIQALEYQVATLQGELRRLKPTTLEAVGAALRAHEIFILHAGRHDPQKLRERLHQYLGAKAAEQALQHVFDLNFSPLPEPQREALRVALRNRF